MGNPSKVPTHKERAQEAFKWAQGKACWAFCERSFSSLQGKTPFDRERARKFLVTNARDIEREYDKAHRTPLGVAGVWELAGLLLAHFESAWCKCTHPNPQRQNDEYFCGRCGSRWEA